MKYLVKNSLTFKGDKSLSHRAAIFTAISQGQSRIENFLTAGDTVNTLKAMAACGVSNDYNSSPQNFTVESPGISGWKNPLHALDLGNAGTGSRLLLGLFSGLSGFQVTIDGDESLRKRPMARICAPLQKYGAHFLQTDHLPITVAGSQIQPIFHEETLGSAQVKTSLMLAALASQVAVEIVEHKPSRDHTENMLIYAGVEVIRENSTIRMKPPYQLQPREYQIFGDISSAAFFVVLALLADQGELLIKNVLLNPFRDGYIKVLQRMGGQIEVINQRHQCGEVGGDLLIKPSRLKNVAIFAEEIPSIIDELPIITIAGLFAEGRFSFRHADELRVKESDRIHAMVSNLQNCGIRVEEFTDGLALEGNPAAVLAGKIDSFMDHRIAMSFIIASYRSRFNAALEERSGQLIIDGQEWINTSFPDFFDKLATCLHED